MMSPARGRLAVALAVALAAPGAGCTSNAYDAAAGWRRSTCDALVDAERRAECLRRADIDREAYQREREAASRR